MKVGIAALLCLFVVSVSAVASNDKPIEVSQLPQAAQQILKKDFGKMKVALAKMESGLFDTSYDIIFTNGDKVEFEGHMLEVTLAGSGKAHPAGYKKVCERELSVCKGHRDGERPQRV